jgi:osmoprotectant transport system ATP-binding protein
MSAVALLELRQVSFRYGASSVLEDVSLRVGSAESVALLGRSGSGKSTVLRLACGLLQAEQGEVLWHGAPKNAEEMRLARRRFGFALQDGGLFPHLTVLDNVMLPARLEDAVADPQARARALLQQVGLIDEAMALRYPHQLSGGQRQRVALARALFLQPEFLLMDEPFGALDPLTQREMEDLFLATVRGKAAVLLVTQDPREALRLCDRIVLLGRGRIVFDGPPADFLRFSHAESEPFLRTLESFQ